jgi:hypothetical protein
MDKDNNIGIDGNGNITIQDVNGSIITINVNDKEKIAELLCNLENNIVVEIQKLITAWENKSQKQIVQNINGAVVEIVPDEYIERDEINTIHQNFTDGNKTLLLLNGEGGIGKTTLAAKYLQTYKNEYKHFAWLLCENGIEEPLLSLRYFLKLDLKDIPENLHPNIIITELNKLPKKCLLILDNANNANHIRQFLQKFGSLEWDVLITSRCNEAVKPYNELKIEHLHVQKAKELFKQYYIEQNDDFESHLDFLLKAIDYNTLILQLFAKHMQERNKNRKGFFNLAQLNYVFCSEGLFFTNKNHIFSSNINEIIEKLYNLSELNQEEEQLIFYFSLLPLQAIAYDDLMQIFQPKNQSIFDFTLDALNEKGWITRTETEKETNYRPTQIIQLVIIAKNKGQFWEKALPIFTNISNLLKIDQSKDNPTGS